MSGSEVLLEVDARGVASVTLNRPRVNNAYDGALIDALAEVIAACARRDDVRVVLVRGNGRHFQAGADLKWLSAVRAQGEAVNLEVSWRTARAVRDLNQLAKPVVALVHGGCFGGGVGLVAACDVVVASEDATFAITEARWGLVASIIVPQLEAAIGVRQVRRWALTCERFDAAQAKAIGLVHAVCPSGGLEEAAAPIVGGLLHAAPEAIAQTKRAALAEGGHAVDDARLEHLVREHAAKRLSAEGEEGLASFRDKREPAWYPGG